MTADYRQRCLSAAVAAYESGPRAYCVHQQQMPLGAIVAAVLAVRDQELERLKSAEERLELCRQAILADGYFTPDQVGPDIAPRITERLSGLRAKLDAPCGTCHPCVNYSDETWQAAGRKPPHVYEWDEARVAIARVRERLDILTGIADGLRGAYGDHAAHAVAAFEASLRRALDGEVQDD